MKVGSVANCGKAASTNATNPQKNRQSLSQNMDDYGYSGGVGLASAKLR